MGQPSELSYKRTVLHACDAFEIVSCEWNKTSVSALHTHGWSQCAVLVEAGFFENRSEFGLKTETSIFEPGQMIVTPLGVEHEIRCMTDFGKTLHVYTPRITKSAPRDVFSTPTLSSLRERIDLQLSNDGTRWVQVEKLLASIGANSVSTESPFFMNQLFSGVLPETLAAEAVASRARTTLATFEASPAFTAVELEVVERLGELIGWPGGSRDGIGVAGGSAANFMAVHCARQRRVPEYRTRGSQGERFKVFVSKEAHYSMKKACLATGIGTDALVEVAVDTDGRMNVDDLRAKILAAKSDGAIPLLACATAGTTVLGSFDPINAMADICSTQGVWLHVDGAWGGPALFSESARKLLRGIDRADSMTFDAHKLFGANLTCSFFLTRQTGVLLEANDVSGGDYIFHSGEASKEIVQDRGRLSWQCGRGPDALSFWTLWKSLGTAGLGDFVDRLFMVRDETVQWLKTQPRLQLVTEPGYLNICVRVVAPSAQEPAKDWSTTVRDRMKAENTAFVNFSKNAEGSFLRLILAHPKIEFAHVKQILEAALEVS